MAERLVAAIDRWTGLAQSRLNMALTGIGVFLVLLVSQYREACVAFSAPSVDVALVLLGAAGIAAMHAFDLEEEGLLRVVIWNIGLFTRMETSSSSEAPVKSGEPGLGDRSLSIATEGMQNSTRLRLKAMRLASSAVFVLAIMPLYRLFGYLLSVRHLFD